MQKIIRHPSILARNNSPSKDAETLTRRRTRTHSLLCPAPSDISARQHSSFSSTWSHVSLEAFDHSVATLRDRNLNFRPPLHLAHFSFLCFFGARWYSHARSTLVFYPDCSMSTRCRCSYPSPCPHSLVALRLCHSGRSRLRCRNTWWYARSPGFVTGKQYVD